MCRGREAALAERKGSESSRGEACAVTLAG